ncbi:unnamed protein product [Microthlaspi erraticum]|uniref:Uncharacterized protein n=1 Tax=Microthlaspi erraticum TaxID=1685480 RepID=A0A6D2JB95_9BRAS|nr:unnamed protein product [Microthlaspi erraticum]
MAAGISPHPDSVPSDLLFLYSSPPSLSASSDPISVPSSSSLSAGIAQPLASLECPISVSSPGDRYPLVVSPATSALEKPASCAAKFKPHFKNLSKVGSPIMSSDGILQIHAHDSIVLKPATTWKNHIVAYFHGNPPSPAKIFSDLYPIWVHAPVWVLFRRVPRELWSEVGFSTIASAVGIPVHTDFPNIKPYSNGVVKLRVVIELAKKRANSVRITDKLGNSVLVLTEIQKLPPKCGNCKEFGHLVLRCPLLTVPVPIVRSNAKSVVDEIAKSPLAVSPPRNLSVNLLRPCLALFPLFIRKALGGNVEDGFTVVHRRSTPPPCSLSALENAKQSSPVTSAQFREEEDIIKSAQLVIRNRFNAWDATDTESCPASLSLKQKKEGYSSASLGVDYSVGTEVLSSGSGTRSFEFRCFGYWFCGASACSRCSGPSILGT